MPKSNCIGGHDLDDDIFTAKQTGQHFQSWALKYGESLLLFHCQATDILHAIRQCKDAHPDAPIVAATLNSTASVPVFHLNPDDEASGWNPTGEFSANVNDLRGITDKVYIDTALSDGRTDDVVTLQVEIGRIAGSEDRGKLHLQFIDDQIAVSIHKRGDKYIFGMEAAIALSETALSNEVRGRAMH